MEFLNKLINFTLRQSIQIESTIDNSFLSISGNYIRLSQVSPNITMLTKALVLNSLHTAFIEADISKPGFKVVIIAPNWVIINQRKIDLSASPGRGPTPSKVQPSNPGIIPSLPGGSGGHYYGIGSPLMGDLLKILANGGEGGHGQNGMDGRAGSNGADMNWKDAKCVRPQYHLWFNDDCYGDPYLEYSPYSFKKILNPPCDHPIGTGKLICGLWLAFGQPGAPGMNGGSGGAGGFGGNKGTSAFSYIGKNNLSPSNIHIIAPKTGVQGKNGTGGSGGTTILTKFEVKEIC